VYMLLGPIAYEVSPSAVGESTVPFRVRWVDTGWRGDPSRHMRENGKVDRNKVLDDLLSSEARDAVLLGAIASAGKPCLALTERVSHAKSLAGSLLKMGVAAALATGGTRKAEREAAIDAAREGRAEVLVATAQLAREGLDIPCLRTLALCSPLSDAVAVKQSVGRVCRKAEGKTGAEVVDFLDDEGYLMGLARRRQRIYGELGAS